MVGKKRILFFVLLFFTVIVPSLSYAAGFVTVVPPDCNTNPGGCQLCDIALLANNLIHDAIFLAVFASAILFAIAGFQYLTAGGDTGKAKKAKGIFKNVIIGLLIILTAWLLVNVVMSTLTGGPLVQWNRIC